MNSVMDNESLKLPKHRIKDSVFTSLFRDKNNILKMYRSLHPEMTDITVDDIDIKTLKAVFINTLQNDLGFTVKDRYVIIVEAQSSWNYNMPLRMLFYLVETYRRYLKDTEQNPTFNPKVTVPKPELYVIYTGCKDVPQTLSLSETFFDGDPRVELKVKVIVDVDHSIQGQYVGYCKVYDEQFRKYKTDKNKCIKETLRICLEKGYLVDFIHQYQKEVVSMMEELFDEDYLRKAYDNSLRKQFLAEGRAKGRAEGEAKGRAEGEAKGRAEGINSILEKMRKSGMSEEQIENVMRM